MFDAGITYLIDGVGIDSPQNAVTLCLNCHKEFGNFTVFFTALDEPHMYRIESFLPILPGVPVTQSLFLMDSRAIDPPSPRLLALHNAIAHILHLSAAGDYIDRILQEQEEVSARADGSSNLARLVSLRLGGWTRGNIHTF